MSKGKATSKYDCDPHLFWPQPPESPKHIKALFCGRERELEAGLAVLKRGLDVGARRSREFDKQPWVIHGESRSGKSHLARRIQAGLPTGRDRIHLLVSAQERMEALAVMRELFERLRTEFAWRVQDQTLAESPLAQPQVRLVNQLVQETAQSLGGRGEKETITLEVSDQDMSESGLEVGLLGKLLRFVAKFQTGRSETRSIQVVLRNPTARDLAELCGLMAETLVTFKLVTHVMVLVDDVDLLEGYVDADRNGRIQRSVLADTLAELHVTPGVDVLLTARSWYARAKKELRTLVDLTEFPMRDDQLVAIHDRRQDLLGAKKVPSRFLSAQALAEVAHDARGLPGVFLQHLDTSFRQYQGEPVAGERSYEWFLSGYRRLFEEFGRKCPPAALSELREAVREGRTEIVVTRVNPFHATVFENEFVYQSYYAETTYFLSGLVGRILAEAPPPQPGDVQQ